MRHLIDPTDLSVAEIGQIIALAEDIIANRAKYSEACKGKTCDALLRAFDPHAAEFHFGHAGARRQRHRLFGRRFVVGVEGRNGRRYGTGDSLLRRHHRHAPFQGGGAAGRFAVCGRPGHQRRRRQPQPPDADADRPADDQARGAAGSPDDRLLRRSEIRPHGAFAYQGEVALRRDSGGADRPDELRLPEYMLHEIETQTEGWNSARYRRWRR